MLHLSIQASGMVTALGYSAPATLAAIRAEPAAWAYHEMLPPSYRTKLHWWVLSAKQPATRARRLATLIEACAEGRRL